MLVGTWQGHTEGVDAPFHVAFRRDHTWTMWMWVEAHREELQKGNWKFENSVLMVRTDGQAEVVRHTLVSLDAQKAIFDRDNPFILTREDDAASNQAMQPTARRRTVSLSMTNKQSFEPSLASISGG